ncbi:WD40 repeat protein [Dyadobacter jejuensis]|uniref:WD40 repeat protein n=1 Tax=Dyadobacter jejuensis TaxID=1082580 RepID=A0A316AL56_9BACT|nr:DUF3748 domain-containing protein [Dyadobacter jejuensis]PWJ57774.1 WD40 repeat protein [Dyadobacter jejuensis]
MNTRKLALLVPLALLNMINACAPQRQEATEKQLTFDTSYHHDLDNNDNFSPDGQWLVYDTRTDSGGIAESGRIERVNTETGEIKITYSLENNTKWGPGVGAVSYSPKAASVVFIHGLMDNDAHNPYQQWRRTGVIVEDAQPGNPIWMDARDVTYPYTPGALRGGTHRHEWSGDGQWIGYTYNDAILQEIEAQTGEKRNLRTIGVSKNIGPVTVDAHPGNVSGSWYSALVVRVVPEPTPGSDEISHAAYDSWIGLHGYQKPDGSQQMARAFLGTVRDKKGQEVQEVFVVDIPDDITVPGPLGPIEGTKDDFPMPPQGAVQRRLTHTAESEHPGCSGIVRSAPDGSQLCYLAKDENGITQIFLLSPVDGKSSQLTHHDSDVEGHLRWNPNGKEICYFWNGSLAVCIIGDAPFNERYQLLTEPDSPAASNPVWSPDGTKIAYNRLIPAPNGAATQQIFIQQR